MNVILNNIGALVVILSIMCIFVSMVIQLIKDVGILAKIPTQAVTIVVSIIVCTMAYCFYTVYNGLSVQVWYFVACIFGGFIVAFITSYGWDSLYELWKRFFKTESDIEKDLNKMIEDNSKESEDK